MTLVWFHKSNDETLCGIEDGVPPDAGEVVTVDNGINRVFKGRVAWREWTIQTAGTKAKATCDVFLEESK